MKKTEKIKKGRQERGVLKSPRFWILLAVVMVLLAVALFFILRPREPKDPYPPVASNESELRPVLTFGETTVPYELLRTYYLSCRDVIGESGRKLNHTEAMSASLPLIAEIYAQLQLASELGIDPYGEAVEEALREKVRVSVEGETGSDGFASYNDYLKHLKDDLNMTDAVARLILRADICRELSYASFCEASAPSDAEVQSFYLGENCARITHVFGYDNEYVNVDTLLDKALGLLSVCRNETQVRNVAMQYSWPAPEHESVVHNLYFGKNSFNAWDRLTFSSVISAMFTLPENACSPILDAGARGKYVLYQLPRTTAELQTEAGQKAAREAYLEDSYYTRLNTLAETIAEGMSGTELYASLTEADF